MWVNPRFDFTQYEVADAFVNGMAKAFFLSAVSSAYEDAARYVPLGAEWANLTNGPDTASLGFANHVAWMIAAKMHHTSLPECVKEVLRCSGYSPFDRAVAETLGFNVGMEALGHGISWLDQPEHCFTEGFQIPDVEFNVELQGTLYSIEYATATYR